MLLNILQCIGHPPHQRLIYPAQHVNSARLGNCGQWQFKKQDLTFIEHVLCVRGCAKHFTCTFSFTLTTISLDRLGGFLLHR